MMNLKQLAIAVVLGTAGLSVGPHAEAAFSPGMIFESLLGATLGDSNSPPGALVTSTAPGGPFADEGIQPMDVIIAVNATPCTSAISCEELIDHPPRGTKIVFNVRDHSSGTVYEAWVTLA